jgi:hypothetical protein
MQEYFGIAVEYVTMSSTSLQDNLEQQQFLITSGEGCCDVKMSSTSLQDNLSSSNF